MSSAPDHSYRTRIFNDLFRDFHEIPFAVESADGWRWASTSTEDPKCTLKFKTPAAWRALMEDPSERTLGEAFIHGDIDIEGDLFSIFPIVQYVLKRPTGSRYRIARTLWRSSADFARLLRFGQLHSKSRDRAAISYHYNQPVEFYRPFLGPTLVYSCAYFREPSEELDCAQKNKLELICRKLDLQASDRFLDIGCGWGSLVIHAASQYGAESRGITLSTEQESIGKSRIAHAQLENRCAVELRDYRDMNGHRFDKIASVGMFEHVGLKNLPRYFAAARDLLTPNGIFLNHGIARSATSAPAKDSFIDRYVFPDGELVPLGRVLEIAEAAGFEIRDVDNLRSHYERTLRLWVENLQRNREAVLQHVSEETYRIWLVYMAGSAEAFRRGDIELYQVLLAPRPIGATPTLSTRERWYKSWSTAESKAAVL
jgi:cyclopropane-fatty-acyl-phospholipid synthase